MAYSWWQKALGWIRKVLNAANSAGMIPSQKPGIGDSNLGKPHDPTFPDTK